MIRIRRWKFSQGKDGPGLKATISLSIELDLSFDIRDRRDTKLVGDLAEILVAIRERAITS